MKYHHKKIWNTISNWNPSQRRKIIPIDDTAGITFLHIGFPLPLEFPKLYLKLQEVISNLDDGLSKPYERTHDCVKDPESALAYIITHLNIERVSKSIWAFPLLNFDQVYYSTYIDTSQYTSLQCLIDITGRNLQVHNALVQKCWNYGITSCYEHTFKKATSPSWSSCSPKLWGWNGNHKHHSLFLHSP